ncbi:MAG: hypothetical protein PHP29_04540 [Tissierellia bacterium]|nr:hypothetical protein [Tissierellia bacterium]
MGDTIVFMSAYATTKYSKSKRLFKQKTNEDKLLDKYHLTYMLIGDKLISSKGALKLIAKYDYVQQSTTFSFEPIKKKHTIDDFDEIIKRTGFCIKLLHAQSVLADPLYFKIDYFLCMESFLVHVGEHIFQVDPVIFSMNRTLIITFEVIDFETGIPLKKDDVFGKVGNYNLLTINEYQYFGEESTMLSNNKIPEIIYNNVSSFFSEMIGEKFIPEDYSFIHNTLVLSNEVNDVADYFCNLIGTRELSSPLENISSTENYQYYPQDGASVITKYNPDDVDIPLYNGIILEAIKLNIYLQQIINMEITEDMNMVIRNDLYLENLFFAPHVPIETHNLLSYIYNTNSFQHHKEATKLKISYMAAENESKKSKNGVLLNVLLYIISLIGSIGTLDTLEYRLQIPFKYSFPIVILIFLVFGTIWGITEWKRNQRF